MTNKYESVIVFHPDLQPPKLETEILAVRKLLETHGAQELTIEDWGRKELGHPCKKQHYGRFIAFHYTAQNHEVVNESNLTLRITDSVIKFQSHRRSEKQPRFRGNPRLLERKSGSPRLGDDEFDGADA